jgi:hypothetical protein
MPRTMPDLAGGYARCAGSAAALALGIEEARASLPTVEAQAHLPVHRIELAYELSYLRAFTAWEDFLEQAFLRYLCGYAARHGQETPSSGAYCTTISTAKATVYGTRSYLLWHNPGAVVTRAKSHFTAGSRFETVISSIQGRLEHFSSIRHRIAHAHADASFDAATMALAGKRYRGSRPGRFLRDWAPHSPTPTRWLDMILVEFRGLAHQITP